MPDIHEQGDRLDSVRPCSHCQGLGEVDPAEFIDENDLEAIRKELVACLADEGDYGLTSQQRSRRIRMASRVIWLANRVVWLENHENVKTEDDARYEAIRLAKAQEIVDAKVEAGELVRLTGGRVVAAYDYDPAKHGLAIGAAVQAEADAGLMWPGLGLDGVALGHCAACEHQGVTCPGPFYSVQLTDPNGEQLDPMTYAEHELIGGH